MHKDDLAAPGILSIILHIKKNKRQFSVNPFFPSYVGIFCSIIRRRENHSHQIVLFSSLPSEDRLSFSQRASFLMLLSFPPWLLCVHLFSLPLFPPAYVFTAYAQLCSGTDLRWFSVLSCWPPLLQFPLVNGSPQNPYVSMICSLAIFS